MNEYTAAVGFCAGRRYANDSLRQTQGTAAQPTKPLKVQTSTGQTVTVI